LQSSTAVSGAQFWDRSTTVPLAIAACSARLEHRERRVSAAGARSVVASCATESARGRPLQLVEPAVAISGTRAGGPPWRSGSTDVAGGLNSGRAVCRDVEACGPACGRQTVRNSIPRRQRSGSVSRRAASDRCEERRRARDARPRSSPASCRGHMQGASGCDARRARTPITSMWIRSRFAGFGEVEAALGSVQQAR